jgi:hypothetical protein
MLNVPLGLDESMNMLLTTLFDLVLALWTRPALVADIVRIFKAGACPMEYATSVSIVH